MITYHLGTHRVHMKKSGGEEANVGNCTNIIMYGNHIQLSKSKPCSLLGACDLGLTCATLSTKERREESIGAHSMLLIIISLGFLHTTATISCIQM